MRRRPSVENIQNPEFWKSVQELSLQEKSLYADIDYTRGKVNVKREKEYFLTRLLRNLMFFLFAASLIVDFVYTAYTSYEDKLWDVFTCCMISYFFLLLFSACESPVAMVIFVFCFLFGRSYTILLREKYETIWKINPASYSFYSLLFFLAFILIDQLIEICKA